MTSFVTLAAVRKKCPEKYITNRWYLLHDNAPAHRPVLVNDFLAKNNVTTPKHTPYSPHLSVADFYLLPRLKLTLKGRCFGVVTDVIKNATEELKRLAQYGFREYL
jgi:hypothetical protein